LFIVVALGVTTRRNVTFWWPLRDGYEGDVILFVWVRAGLRHKCVIKVIRQLTDVILLAVRH